MENKQTNHGKIKIVAGIFTAALVAALLYWLFTSLLNVKQHGQRKKEPDHVAASQIDDENTSPQRPNTNSKSSSDDNKTDQSKR